MKMSIHVFLIYCLVVLVPGFGFASDLAREQRLAEQTLASLFIGEPVNISIGDSEFLGLETQAVEQLKGAVILLHGRGLGPDSEIVVGPLRELLADDGWHTLSLQMPVLEKGAKYYDYVDVFKDAHIRIEAGIEHLENQGISPIVLLAHSCGVHMSMDWIRSNDIDSINGYIGLGMGATDYRQPMKQPFPFSKMNIPILDVFGSEDYPAVVSRAQQRFDNFKDSHTISNQIVIDQADHEFIDQTDTLFEVLSPWLDTLLESSASDVQALN